MKHRIVFFLLAALTITTLTSFAPAALAADDPAVFDHNIDYSGNLNADKYKLVSEESRDYWIDLNAERLYASDPSSIKAISLDGGNKWKQTFIPADGLDLSKIFNKSSKIHIATGLDAKTKKPAAASEDGTTPADSVYTFKAIKARPKIDRVVVDYEIDADATGATNGRWVLARKGETSALSNYQIAPAPDKKNIARVKLDASGKATSSSDGKQLWATFKTSGGAVQGVNVIGLSSANRAQKLTYMVRIGPDMSTLTPASKLKKLSVAGISKAPNFKADYKNDIIKLKEGARSFEGDADALAVNAQNSEIKEYDKLAAKNGMDIFGLMEESVCLWMAPTAKKPASAVQTVTFAKRGILDESLQPTVKTGKVTIQTKYLEVYNESTKKWGSVPKLTEDLTKTPLRIRGKATAKGGKESDTTFSASAEGQLVLEWGEYAAGKNGVVSALLIAPEYEGIFRITPEKARHKEKESSSETDAIDLVFDLKGLYGGASVVLQKDKNLDKDLDMKSVQDGKIWLRPAVTYTPATSPSDSLIILYDDAKIEDGKLILPVVPDLACDAEFKIEYAIGGGFDPAYDTAKSGTVATRVIVEAVDTSVELAGLKNVYIGDYDSGGMVYPPRVTVSQTKPKSGTSIRRAMTKAGEISIDHEGPAQFSNDLTLEGYTDFTFASAKDDKTLPSASGFTSGRAALTDGGWLFVKATKGEDGSGDDIDPVFFAYAVKDAYGPKMKSVEFDNANPNRLIVTADEDFGKNAKTSSASFMLETFSSDGTADRVWFAGSITLSGNRMTVTFENSIAEASYNNSVLTYSFGGSFVDEKGNAMQPDSILVNGPASGPGSVSFANGSRGGPVTIPLPRAVADLSQNHAAKVAYIALNGSSTGAVTISGAALGEYDGYLITNELMTSTRTVTTLKNGDAISGLSAGNYVYIKAGSNWYVFQVVKAGAASLTDTTPPSMSSGKLTKSGNDYTVEITASKSVLNYGYGAQPKQFEIADKSGALTDISVSEIKVSGNQIKLTLTGADLERIVPETKLRVSYKAGGSGIADANGNRMRGLSMDKDLALSGITSPSPSPSP